MLALCWMEQDEHAAQSVDAARRAVALTCILAAVANAAAFTNDHHIGRHVYNIAAAIAGFGAVYSGIAVFAHLALPFASLAGIAALLIGVATTWLRPFRVLYA